MLIATFGSLDPSTIERFKGTGHTLMVTDHPAEAETLRHVITLEVRHVVCRAEWRNLTHSTSKIEPRVNNATNEVEDCNTNGGFTRDARMAERAEAILFGGGVNVRRRESIEHFAGSTPFRDVEPPKLSPEEAEAELDKVFA